MATSIAYLDKSDARIPRKKRTAIVERTLQEIVDSGNGITVHRFVEIARNPEHEAHQLFEWDDSVAAEKYRIQQATSLILATRFVAFLVDKRNKKKVEEAIKQAEAKPVRKYLPDYRGSEENTVYRLRNEVLADAESRKAIVERKLATLRGWCVSVVDIEELRGIRESIESMLAAG